MNNPYASPSLINEVKGNGPQNVNWGLFWGIGAIICIGLRLFFTFEKFLDDRFPLRLQISLAGVSILRGTLEGVALALCLRLLVQDRWSLRNLGVAVKEFSPGHWAAFAAATDLFGIVSASPWFGGPVLTLGELQFSLSSIIQKIATNAAGMGFFTSVLFLTREPLRWRIIAGVTVLFFAGCMSRVPFETWIAMHKDAVFVAVYRGLLIFNGVLSLTAVIGSVIGLVFDWRNHILRDGLHWAAVILGLSMPVLGLVLYRLNF